MMSILGIALALIAAQAPAAQAPAAQATGQAGDDGWQLHNTVDGVVEGRIITRKKLIDGILAPDSPYKISSQEDLLKAHAEAFDKAVLESLRLQAGEGLGSQIGDIDLAVKRQILDERRAVGIFEYQEQLEAQEIDPITDREQRREDFHRQLWEASVTGDGVSSDGRVSRDRYLRPGLLRVLYSENRDMLREPPPAVRLQALVVSSAAAGGIENARAVCSEQRAEIIAGKVFADAVDEFGAQLRDSGGETGWLEITRLVDPTIKAYAENAQVGDISPVVDAMSADGREPVGAQILRILEVREGGEAPSFSDPRVQRHLSDIHGRLLRDRRLDRAERLLAGGAYVWRAGS